MVWNTRASRLRRVEERVRAAAPSDGTREERIAQLTKVLAAERRVLQLYEKWAAMPYEERGAGCRPEASRLAQWSDEAMAARLQRQRAGVADLEAALASATSRA